MKRLLMLIMALALFVTACGDTAETPNEVEIQPAPETEEEEGIFPRPTVTTALPGEEESYPPPPPQPETEDYPAPQALPTIDAYPVVDGYVWVVHPLGTQCEDGRFYDSVDAAVSALTEADIDVLRGTTTDLNVCLACGCPTSTHYRLHIAEDDLPTAERLGWTLFTE
jgi:hypothetical protein